MKHAHRIHADWQTREARRRDARARAVARERILATAANEAHPDRLAGMLALVSIRTDRTFAMRARLEGANV
jgi:hypothetical protein